MSDRLLRVLFSVIAVLASAFGSAFGHSDSEAAIPLPSASAVGDTPPPLSATATPRPTATLLRYSGQLLDYQRGFVFFTTGDGYRIARDIKIDDAKTGGHTRLIPETGKYAIATFDSVSGLIEQLDLSSTPLPTEATYQDVQKFAVTLSTPYANPDLRVGAQGFNGKPVLVAFYVQVPPETRFDADVYLATDASGWSATAIRMNRIDASHYRVSRLFPSGTRLLYRYTLGSWQAAERGENGLEVAPRSLVVQNGDVRTQRDIVYHWGATNQFNPQNNQALPTPYNPIPFNTPPH